MKDKYEELVNQRKSTYDIAKELGVAQTTVRYWLKQYGLRTNPIHKCYTYTATGIDQTKRTCPQCQKTKDVNSDNFYIIKKTGKPHAWCKKCNDKIAYEKQLERKRKAVEYKGGRCCVCGYNRYIGALDFHHIDPSVKEFNISHLRSYSWGNVKSEVDKCVLVCKNCHSEIHHGLIDLKSLGPTGFEPVIPEL